VIPWTDIDWDHAKTAIENRGGAANSATGTCADPGSGNTDNEFLVSDIAHLVGQHLEISVGGVTYYRRIIQQGKYLTGDTEPNSRYVKFYPDLPTGVDIAYATSTYKIIGHHMITPYEWFSLLAWSMTYRYQFGLGHCKGNNDWGKDIGDARAIQNEGIPDPVRYGYSSNNISRCLTGSGPLSWSLNGKENGVWDLNGNVWEWTHQKIGGTANYTIDVGYPGEGVTVPSSSSKKIKALYAPAITSGRSLAPFVCSPNAAGDVDDTGTAEFGYDGYWVATGARAAIRGGHWYHGLLDGLSTLSLYDASTYTYSNFGFRGAL
jgi:hypothetical protein